MDVLWWIVVPTMTLVVVFAVFVVGMKKSGSLLALPLAGSRRAKTKLHDWSPLMCRWLRRTIATMNFTDPSILAVTKTLMVMRSPNNLKVIRCGKNHPMIIVAISHYVDAALIPTIEEA